MLQYYPEKISDRQGLLLATALVRHTFSAVGKGCNFAVGDGSLSAYIFEDQACEIHVHLIHVHRQLNCALGQTKVRKEQKGGGRERVKREEEVYSKGLC